MGLFKWFVAAVLALFVMSGAGAQQVVLKLGMQIDQPDSAWADIIKPWMDGITAQSDGRIRFDMMPVASVEEAAGLYVKLRDGELDVLWAQTGLDPKRFKRTEVFELPFMMPNPEAASRALWEYVETYAVDEFKDVRLLGLHVKGASLFHTRERPIDSLADLKGMRLRGGNRMTDQFLKQLGAEFMGPQLAADPANGQPEPERQADGYVCDWASAVRLAPSGQFQFHTGFGTTGALATSSYMLAINPKTYESLPEELRRILDANSGMETSAAFGRRAQRISSIARDRVGASEGYGSIRTLPLEEAQAFRKAAVKVEQAWVAEVSDKGFEGQTLLDGARTLIKKYTR